jgi:hypothetical protein
MSGIKTFLGLYLIILKISDSYPRIKMSRNFSRRLVLGEKRREIEKKMSGIKTDLKNYRINLLYR